MPLTNYGEPYMLQMLFGSISGGVSLGTTVPQTGGTNTSWQIGLIRTKTTNTTVGTWQKNTAYAAGDIIIPSNFAATGGTNHIYYASSVSGTGTSSATTEPTWPTTAGATVTDNAGANQIVWTEATTYFYSSANLISAEIPTAGSTSYARATLTNSQGASTWVAPTTPAAAAPASTNWGSAINFPSSGASWGYVVGFFLSATSTPGAGTALAWNTLNNFVPVLTSGMTLTLPATTGVTVTLS